MIWSAVLLPGAAFRSDVGSTPPARGWSSAGHHQAVPPAARAAWMSCSTSARHGDGGDPATTDMTSVVDSGTKFRWESLVRCSGQPREFFCSTYQRLQVTPLMVAIAARIRTGVPGATLG